MWKNSLKGQIGEALIRQRLEAKGFVVYQPVTDAAHAFDMLAIKDKKKVIALDVKTKPSRMAFPDTGVNLAHYELYSAFSTNHLMDFWLVFIDENAKRIYGNKLSELDKTREVKHNGQTLIYPRNEPTKGGVVIRYWPLCAMLSFGAIAEEVADKLSELRHSDWLGTDMSYIAARCLKNATSP